MSLDWYLCIYILANMSRQLFRVLLYLQKEPSLDEFGAKLVEKQMNLSSYAKNAKYAVPKLYLPHPFYQEAKSAIYYRLYLSLI